MSSDELPPPSGLSTSPTPTPHEAVAIVAAMDALWPRPVVDVVPVEEPRLRPWRFSGRWWSRPVAARRDRPFR